MSLRPDFSTRVFRVAISRLLVFWGCVFFAAPLVAQTPFVLNNLGQKIDTDDARMVGRGGWGMAVSDSTNPGFKNTASLSAVRQVAVSYSGYGIRTNSKDDNGERILNRVVTPEIRLAIPVVKGRFAVTTGFSIDRAFRYETEEVFPAYVHTDTILVMKQFFRQGTLFNVPIGFAGEVLPGLSLGSTANLVRGPVKEYLNYLFFAENSTRAYEPILQSDKRTFMGTSYTLSTLYKLGDRARIGASWTPSYDVDVDRELSIEGVNARYSSSYSMTIPDEYMFGFQANLSGRWILGGDYQLQTFSQFYGSQEWAAEGVLDEYTVSCGLERRVAYERRGGLDNLPLRLGFSTRQWAYQVGGSSLQENTFSIGTGFPFRGKLGVMDLGLSYSRIGDLEKNGLEDSVWKLSITVTGIEKWW